MTKTTKVALFSLPILAGLYLIYTQLRRNKTKPSVLSVNPVTNTLQSISSEKCDYPLQFGVYNCNKVAQLQSLLNAFEQDFPNKPLVQDGDFGAKTEKALQSVWGKKSIQTEAEFDDLVHTQWSEQADTRGENITDAEGNDIVVGGTDNNWFPPQEIPQQSIWNQIFHI
jgi:hypothetical protein